jgi:hypothetical protein
MKGELQFVEKGKLSPRFVRTFMIFKKLSKLAYQVCLPLDLVGMHDFFHVSMLRKCIMDPDHVIKYEPQEL